MHWVISLILPMSKHIRIIKFGGDIMCTYFSRLVFFGAVLTFLGAGISNAYAAPPSKPTITTQPVSVTVSAPATATFTVVASSDTPLTYQWKQAFGSNKYTTISGATAASYTTPPTTAAMSGTKYQCVVSNASGSVTSNAAILTVDSVSIAPTIITQPVDVTVQVPKRATFSVVASGSPEPAYQWQKAAPGSNNFSSITGATAASYGTTTPETTIENSGTRYRCVVSNSAGSVTSAAASLTVAGLPMVEITSPASNSSFTVGADLTITASASEINGTITSVSFYNGSTLLGTSTTAPYTYTITNAPVGIYSLTAVATDAFGTSATSSPVVVMIHGLPEVSVESPSNQSGFTTGSVNITAIAREDYGTISYVDFYNGSTLLGRVTSTFEAFTYSWINVPAGTHNLTAVATDVSGLSTTSSPITVTVSFFPFSYGVDDNIVSETDALNNTTSYEHDKLNRLLKTTFADGSRVSYAYDAFGNQISVTDQRGNVLIKTYDAFERLSQIEDPKDGITQFNYDTEGRLRTLTDANEHATTYTYDPNGRVLTQTNALNLLTTFTYDPVGNVLTGKDANGETTSYTYDALNRLTKTTYPDNSQVTNVYDALGRMTSMTDSTGVTTYTYDALDRLLTKKSPGTNNTINYVYDGEGNRLTTLDQNGRTVTNTYDALNRLASVQDQNGITSYEYDANSNLLSMTSPNGVVENYTYDSLNRVLSAVIQNGATVISSYTNVYDIAGMVKQKIFADGSWTIYTYDTQNQLLNETKQTGSSTIYSNIYTYDPVGNRLTWRKDTTLGGFWSADYLNMPSSVLTSMTNAGYGKTANPALAVSLVNNYSNDAANRLTGWNGTISVGTSVFPVQAVYTYDNNGNRINKIVSSAPSDPSPRQTSYAYDFENRLNRLTYENIPDISGTQTDRLIYNGEGLRTQVVLNDNAATGNALATDYLYDGSNILVERDDSGSFKTYTRAIGFPGGIAGLIAQSHTSNNTPVVQYYHYDDLGSVAALTGTAANNYSYDAFGNLINPQTSGDTNRYLFSTKEFDSRAGLYYFGARYYDPQVGRWLTPDPLGYLDSMNLYIYVENSPINWSDPFGLFVFGRRPLASTKWFKPGKPTEILDRINHEPFHEHGFFEDGSGQNIGYNGTVGIFSEDPTGLGYVYESKHYDDDTMREAFDMVKSEPIWKPNKYELCGLNHHNCQDFAEALRNEYKKVINKMGKENAHSKK